MDNRFADFQKNLFSELGGVAPVASNFVFIDKRNVYSAFSIDLDSDIELAVNDCLVLEVGYYSANGNSFRFSCSSGKYIVTPLFCSSSASPYSSFGYYYRFRVTSPVLVTSHFENKKQV